MTAGARLLQAAALACAAFLYGLAADQPLLGASLATLLLLAAAALALTGRRGAAPHAGLALGPLPQAALALVALPAAWALTPASAAGPTQLGPFWAGLAAVALVLALPRPFLARPHGGHAGTLGLGLLAVLASGGARLGPAYPALMGAYLVIALTALSASDPGRPRWRALALRHRVGVALGLTLSAGIALSAALALPPAHDWAIRKLGYDARANASGFSTSLQLGGLTDLLLSDAPVLRVTGPRPDYLRGAAYDLYFKGRWLTRARTRSVPLPAAAPPAPTDPVVELRPAKDLDRRVFLPLDARAIAVPGATPRADNWGLVTVGPGDDLTRARFVPGPRDRALVDPPSDVDTEIPRELRPVLTALAFDWTQGADTREARLAALVRRFHTDFTYSLRSRHPDGRDAGPRATDPIMHFLLEDRRGHCEYFASAMALLARSLGIPARVVGGYRVTERNPVGDYWLVRERDAHAWVEAWVPERGWVTVEPTPPSGLAEAGSLTTSWWAGAFDLLSDRWRRGLELLMAQDPLAVVALGAGPLLLVLLLLRLRGRTRRRGPAARHAGAYSPPPPCLTTLLDALAGAGLARAPHESLEALAARAAVHPGLGADAPTAAALLTDYAAWRYGAQGDAAELATRIQAFARRPLAPPP